MDIIFFDLELNKLHVLPSASAEVGYISATVKTDFNGCGSLQIKFWDSETESIIKAHPEGLILKFGTFEGLITDYQFTEYEKRIYGMHLNALLHKFVVPTVSFTDTDTETAVYGIITANCPHISLAEAKGTFPLVTYQTDRYRQADELICEMLKAHGLGYAISLDLAEKRYVFELLNVSENPLMLSKNNLNAYDFEENLDIKGRAFGGWYEDSEKVWHHVGVEASQGLRYQDVILSAKTEEEAITELSHKKAEYTITAKTKNITYGMDYKLGDIVRVQLGKATVRRKIVGVEQWHEQGTFNEQPIMEELQEAANDN